MYKHVPARTMRFVRAYKCIVRAYKCIVRADKCIVRADKGRAAAEQTRGGRAADARRTRFG